MHPTPRCVLLLTAVLPVAALPALLGERLWPVWLAVLAFSLFLCAFDALLLPRAAQIAVDTFIPPQIYIGTEALMRVRLDIAGTRRKTRLDLLVDLDPELEPLPLQRMILDPEAPTELELALRPTRRGDYRVRRLWMRWSAPLGLVACTGRRELDEELAVVPDVGSVRATALRYFSSPRAFLGLKTERYVGDGSEFESLRRYVPGLDARSIDWKASARHRELVCRRFRAERNHQIVLAIDAGHLMGEPLDGVPRLDRAIHSALLLAYFGLRTGDRVGLASFDARLKSYVEPQGGMRAFPRLQRESAAIAYTTDETNYTLGVLELAARLKRRSLVVVFTEFVDTVTAELLLDNLDQLARRHVVLFLSLRDPALEALEESAPVDLGSLNRAVIATDLRTERERVFRRLRKVGVQVVDALPEEASMELLDHYFAIKRRELV